MWLFPNKQKQHKTINNFSQIALVSWTFCIISWLEACCSGIASAWVGVAGSSPLSLSIRWCKSWKSSKHSTIFHVQLIIRILFRLPHNPFSLVVHSTVDLPYHNSRLPPTTTTANANAAALSLLANSILNNKIESIIEDLGWSRERCCDATGWIDDLSRV